MSSLSDTLPVPPLTSGSSVFAKSDRSSSAPMPCGPISPLCAGTDSAERRSAVKSSGICPAVCAASSANGMPRAAQTSPTAAASCTVPDTLDACASSTSRVLGRSIASILPVCSRPAASHGMRSKATPCFASWVSGRMTALCSIAETSTWSPGRSAPRSSMFSPQVLPGVKITCDGSAKPNSAQSRCRRRRVTSSACCAASYEPRFTDAPTSSTYSRMRAPTVGGLGNEVAALSRYTVCMAVPPGASFSSVYHTAAQM